MRGCTLLALLTPCVIRDYTFHSRIPLATSLTALARPQQAENNILVPSSPKFTSASLSKSVQFSHHQTNYWLRSLPDDQPTGMPWGISAFWVAHAHSLGTVRLSMEWEFSEIFIDSEATMSAICHDKIKSGYLLRR